MRLAAAVMAAGLCSKITANPDEYVQNYLLLPVRSRKVEFWHPTLWRI
jgi:hypothetical protein